MHGNIEQDHIPFFFLAFGWSVLSEEGGFCEERVELLRDPKPNVVGGRAMMWPDTSSSNHVANIAVGSKEDSQGPMRVIQAHRSRERQQDRRERERENNAVWVLGHVWAAHAVMRVDCITL